ncbi:MAG: hypothetical protein LBR93_07870 [Treponema sp.]|jgi:hypothetical protein|nr:hypothetical protein [Treponema sp.]
MKNCPGKDGFRRSRNLFFGTLLLVLGAGLLLASCSDFYSSTWGDAFVRDPSKVNVNSSNVYELLKDANGDTKASRAILEKLKGTTDPKLQAAAVKAANQAAGLTGLVLSNLDTVTGANADNPDSLKGLASSVLGEAKKNDIKGVADGIVETLTVTTGTPPKFEGDFADSVSTSDLTLLLVTMMMAEVEAQEIEGDNPFDKYAEDWGTKKKIDGTGLNGNERVIAAIANEVKDRPDSNLGKMLKELVGE